MESYNPYSKCDKCGCDQVSFAYTWYMGSEWINKTCARCGYKWTESCLDAKKDV